jgi:Tfp pilus assembly protein PilW
MSGIYDLLGSSIIGGLLILTALRLNASVMESTVTNNQNLAIQQETALVTELLDRDLNNIGYGDTASSKIKIATGTSLVFRSDVNRDGKVDTVAYYYITGSNVSPILTSWGFRPSTLPVNQNDTILFRLSTTSEGGTRGTPTLVSSRLKLFSFSYRSRSRVSLGSNPSLPDSIRYIIISTKLSDVLQAADSNRAIVHWQKIYRPKNLGM